MAAAGAVHRRNPDRGTRSELCRQARATEHPAILRWMVDGCLEWQRDGLAVPDRVRQASDDYFANQDTLEQWLEDCCLGHSNNPLAFEATRMLFVSWKAWAEARNTPSGSKKAFAQSLADKGYQQHRMPYARGFKGIQLKAHDGPDGG